MPKLAALLTCCIVAGQTAADANDDEPPKTQAATDAKVDDTAAEDATSTSVNAEHGVHAELRCVPPLGSPTHVPPTLIDVAARIEAVEESEKLSPKPTDEKNEEMAEDESAAPESMPLPEGVKPLSELETLASTYKKASPVLEKLSIFGGDITMLQVDAIVNAANSGLRGGGGVDGAIHRAAGSSDLQKECRKHETPLDAGEAVSTDSCRLSTHVKRIIHAVGPMCFSGAVTRSKRRELISCYKRSLEICEEEGLRSVAFCCISTGIYGYPNDDAAFNVTRFLTHFLKDEKNRDKFDRIVLVLFMDIDKRYYTKFLSKYAENENFFEELERDAEGSSDDEDDEGDDDKEKKEEKDKDGDKETKEGKKKDEEEGGKGDGSAESENNGKEDTNEETRMNKNQGTESGSEQRNEGDEQNLTDQQNNTGNFDDDHNTKEDFDGVGKEIATVMSVKKEKIEEKENAKCDNDGNKSCVRKRALQSISDDEPALKKENIALA